MVGIPGRVHRPRFGHEGARPLQVRWQEAQQRVMRAIPEGHPLRAAANGMCDEYSIDRMQDAISAYEKETAAASQPDPRLLAEQRELCQLMARYNSAAHKVKTEQRWVEHARRQWQHRLLKDISPDCFQELAPFDDPGRISDQYTTIFAAREATQALIQKVLWAEDIVRSIHNAQAIEKYPSGDLALRLCQALAARQDEILDRLERVESHLAAIQAGMNPRKRKSTRSATKRK